MGVAKHGRFNSFINSTGDTYARTPVLDEDDASTPREVVEEVFDIMASEDASGHDYDEESSLGEVWSSCLADEYDLEPTYDPSGMFQNDRLLGAYVTEPVGCIEAASCTEVEDEEVGAALLSIVRPWPATSKSPTGNNYVCERVGTLKDESKWYMRAQHSSDVWDTELCLSLRVDEGTWVLHTVELVSRPEYAVASQLQAMGAAIQQACAVGQFCMRDVEHVTIPQTEYGREDAMPENVTVLPWVVRARGGSLSMAPELWKFQMVDVVTDLYTGETGYQRRAAMDVSGGLVTVYARSGYKPDGSSLRITRSSGRYSTLFTRHVPEKPAHKRGAGVDASCNISRVDRHEMEYNKAECAVMVPGGLPIRTVWATAAPVTIAVRDVHAAATALVGLANKFDLNVQAQHRDGVAVLVDLNNKRRRITLRRSHVPVAEGLFALHPIIWGLADLNPQLLFQTPLSALAEFSALGQGAPSDALRRDQHALMDMCFSHGKRGNKILTVRSRRKRAHVFAVLPVGDEADVGRGYATITNSEVATLIKRYKARGTRVRWLSHEGASWAAEMGAASGCAVSSSHVSVVNPLYHLWRVGLPKSARLATLKEVCMNTALAEPE